MSVPRELGLRTIDGRPQLVQQPVARARLAARPAAPSPRAATGRSRRARRTLPARGKALEIDADLRPGTAQHAGPEGPHRQRRGDRHRLRRRRRRALRRPHPVRARRLQPPTSPASSAPRSPRARRKVRLRILVDWSSVEVFAGGGRTVITDQVFPKPTSDGVKLFADGGTASSGPLKVRPLRSSWTQDHQDRGQ